MGKPLETAERLRFPGLWVTARYVFLVGSGTLEGQLTALEGALRTLHDTPAVPLPPGYEESMPDGGGCPVRLTDDEEGWQSLGLGEHRLALTFEVTVPFASAKTVQVERIAERGLTVEEGGR